MILSMNAVSSSETTIFYELPPKAGGRSLPGQLGARVPRRSRRELLEIPRDAAGQNGGASAAAAGRVPRARASPAALAEPRRQQRALAGHPVRPPSDTRAHSSFD